MKIGANAYCWMVFEGGKAGSIAKILDETAQAGYQGIELFDFRHFEKEWGKTDEELMEMIAARGLVLSDLYSQLPYNEPARRADCLADAREHAGILKKFGASEFLVGPPRRSRAPTLQDFKNMAACFNEMGRYLQGEGIQLGIHNHADTMIESREEIDRIMELTDERYVGLCPDLGHVQIALAGVVDTVATHKRRINFIHFKDVKGVTGPRDNWSQKVVPLGQGDVDFPGVMKILREIKYDGWIVTDPDKPTGTPLDTYIVSKKYIDNLLLKI